MIAPGLVERVRALLADGAYAGGWSAVHLTDDARDRLGGPAWLDRAGVDAAIGPLYPLYREPARHLAQLALARR